MKKYISLFFIFFFYFFLFSQTFAQNINTSTSSNSQRQVLTQLLQKLQLQLQTLLEQKAKSSVLVSDNLKITDRIINWDGYMVPNKPRAIDTLIIHSTYNSLGKDIYNVEGVIREYKLYSVGPHYLIDRVGTIYCLVPEKDIGYQAGESKMPDGRIDVNNFSIGIELIYNKNETPNVVQYSQLSKLVKDIKSRHTITNILGHNEVAPGRKTDPWNFNWNKFNKDL
ncbi:MAG: N-acetylmuramoyl-L-alanine amidase [bacterium]